MKMKSMVLVALMLLAILTIGAVSAAGENITADQLTVGDDLDVDSLSAEVVSTENDDFDGSLKYDDDANLKTDNQTGCFEDLDDLVNKSKDNDEIKLNMDYEFEYGANILNIAKPLTIDGQGHTINFVYSEVNILSKNVCIKNVIIEDGKILSTQGNLIFSNCTFSGGYINAEGENSSVVSCNFIDSGISFKNKDCLAINCSFKDLQDYYGHAIGFENPGYVINCTFEDSYKSNSRNVVYFARSGYVFGCSFVNCRHGDTDLKWGSGAIFFEGYGYVKDCSFVDCYSEHNAGAVFFHSDGNIENSIFVNCHVLDYGYGGAVYIDGQGNINNCSFVNCSIVVNDIYEGRGGALYMSDQANITFCSFVNCSCSNNKNYYGGAIYIYGKDCDNIENCYFMNCYSYNRGSAITSENSRIINCTFINDSSVNFQDEDYDSDYNSALINCSFIDSSWYSSNGIEIFNVTVDDAPYELSCFDFSKDNTQFNLTKNYEALGSPLTISGNNVVIDGKGNSIYSSSSECGFRIVGNNVTIRNMNFVGTRIIVNGFNFTIFNCNFSDVNTEKIRSIISYYGVGDYYYGTAIKDCTFKDICVETATVLFYSSPINVNIFDCSFINCTHGISSGISEDVSIKRCDFINCSADMIVLGNTKNKNSLIEDCNFVNFYYKNLEYITGFPVQLSGDGNIVNCNFKNCSDYLEVYPVEYGALYLNGGNVNVINTTFDSCAAHDGYGVVHTGSHMTTHIIGCKFTNNTNDAVYFEGENSYLINTIFVDDNWYCDFPVEISNVTVDGVKVSLWDNLDDFDNIVLTKDFEVLYSPILINKNNVVIDGGGHTINSTPYWAFYITGKNVTLRNINFNSANVYSLGLNSSVVDCTFSNCSSDYKGIVHDVVNIIGCRFINCSIGGDNPRVISFECSSKYNLLSVVNCEFRNISSQSLIFTGYSIGKIDGCNFYDSKGGMPDRVYSIANCNFDNISALMISAVSCNNCNFTNCHRSYSLVYGELSSSISDCNFINCTSDSESIIYSESSTIDKCTFINCSGKKGGAIILEGYLTYNNNKPCIPTSISNCMFINSTDDINNAIFITNYGNQRIINISDSSFIGCAWYSDYKCVRASNVLVDNKLYTTVLPLVLDENNATVELTPDNTIYYSSIAILGDNIVIDGKGNTIRGNSNNVFYIEGKNVTIRNVNFKNCGIDSKSECNVINCTFDNFTDFCQDGAIHGAVTVINCSFANSYSEHIIYSTSCDVINCSFDNECIRSVRSVIGCTFVNSHSQHGEGAIISAKKVINCTFYGMENVLKWVVSIADCSFIDCFPCVRDSGDVVNCNFMNCHGDDESRFFGVDLINHNSYYYMGSVVNCSFINCSSSRTLVSNSDKDIINCSFENCHGGKIVGKSEGRVINCSFVNCLGEEYGSISIRDGEVINCSFMNCAAEEYGLVELSNNNKITNCNFYNCSGNGGVISTEDYESINNIANCNFTDCSSIRIGNDEYVRDYYSYYDDTGKVYVVNCSFDGCYGISVGRYFNPYIINCTFNHCISSSGIAVYVHESSYGRLINSTFNGDGYSVSDAFEVINVTVSKTNSSIFIDDLSFDYANQYSITADLKGADSVLAHIVENSDADIKVNGNKIIISNLNSGNYTLNVTTIPKSNYYASSIQVKLTINKINSSITMKDNFTFIYGYPGYCKVDLKGATGVTAYIDDENAKVIVEESFVKISDLGIGNYTLHVTTIPDENHIAVTKSVGVAVTRKALEIAIKTENINYGQSSHIAVYLTMDATVILELDGQNYSQSVNDSKAVFNISGLKAGKYDVKAIFEGDTNYGSCSVSDSFEVLKVSISSYTYPKTIKGDNFNLRLPDDATGSATLTIDGKNYKLQLKDGQASFNLSQLSNGQYNYKFAYSGDENYLGFTSNTKTLTINRSVVSKVEPEIIIPSLDETSVGKAIAITLPGDAEGSVTLSVGGNDYTFDVVGGVANVQIPDLETGEYNFTITYSGDGKYYPVSQNTVVKVNKTKENATKPTPEIVVPPLDVPSDDGYVAISLPADATGSVTLSINGEEYIFDVVNGVANVKLPDLDDGDYPYTITYSGDGRYSSFTTGGNLNKTTLVDPKITASNLNVLYSSGTYFKATVYGVDGKVAKNTKIVFKVDGKTVKTTETNEKGVASFKVSQIPGKYKVKIVSLGKTITKTLTVKHLVTLKSVTVKKSAKKLVLQATLGKINKKYLKSKKVTFKFNGKKYTKKTNSKGVAKVTITSNVLKKLKVGKKVTYQATYLKDTVKKSVKVKK